MTDRPDILLAIENRVQARDFTTLAKTVNRSGRFRSHLWWVGQYPGWEEAALSARWAGLEVVNDLPHQRAEQPSPSPTANMGARNAFTGDSRWRALAAERIKRGVWLSYFYHRRRLKGLMARTAAILAKHSIRLLVVPEDNVGGPWPALIKAGLEAGVPSVIIPFTVAGASEFAEAYRLKPAFQADRPTNRLLAARHPEWQYIHQGRRLVRLPAGWAWALIGLGMAPPKPWVLHSGLATAIAVESERMREHYLTEGLPEAKLRLTGGLADDVLAHGLAQAESNRRELAGELGLDPDKKIALIALPPDMLALNRPECDFKDYVALATRMIDPTTGRDGWNVILSPHPSLNRSALTGLTGPGVGLSLKPTAELIPLCDLYIASISATIRWAVACAKPVINYDIYRYRYHDFDQAPGVFNREEYADYQSCCHRLMDDEAFLARTARQKAAESSRWGVIDGRAGERMIDLFGRLIGRPRT